MFNLIITIISIALVVATAAASIYYGGSAFTTGTAKAGAATLASQSQQISGAVILFQNANAGTAPGSVGALAPAYLQSVPLLNTSVASGGWALDTTTGAASATVYELASGVNAAVCAQVNADVNHAGAESTAYATVAAAAAGVLATAPYACVNLASTLTFISR